MSRIAATSRFSTRLALLLLGVFGSAALALPGRAQKAGPRPPNFVILFADDLGYGDLGCYGHPTIRTLNLDRMAAEGLRFTQFYSAAEVCTPSRAALLTGRLPVRSGMCSHNPRVLFPNSAGGLPSEEVTLAEGLKAKGYATACVGKWHLGHLPEYLPTRHGFDSYLGVPYSNDMDRAPDSLRGRAAYQEPKSAYWNIPLIRNETVIERPAEQSTLTRRYTEEAVGFIRKNRERPFFLYLPHTFPHTPLFASDAFRGKSPRGLYGDTVEELDWSVGQVLDTLRREGLAENTVVFFTSDNGPWLTQAGQGGSAGLLRDGKGSTWEGGMREPAIAWGPGRIRPGLTRELACTMDLPVTFWKMAGVPAPTDRVLDGMDISPVLLEGGRSPRQIVYYYRGPDLFAVRKGPFKAHYITRAAYGADDTKKHDPPVLYNLERDPSEQFDVASYHPDVLADLAREVERHRANLVPGKPRLEGRINPN